MEKLLELRREYKDLLMLLAITYLIDKGKDFCASIDDEDLEVIEDNAMMTKEFQETFIKIAREIAKECDINDLFSYIAEYVADDNAKKANRMLNIAYNAICLGQLDERFDTEDLCEELGCTEEEFNEIMEG